MPQFGPPCYGCCFIVNPIEPLLEVKNLCATFNVRRGLIGAASYIVNAVNDVSFDIGHGETFGLVGESGSGKSTIGRALLRLVEVSSGSIRLEGRPIHDLTGRMLDFRRDLQVVFQDPYASLNPSMTVADIVGESLSIHFGIRRKERHKRVAALLERVGLRTEQMRQYPAEFSGGQRQRIAIARALALEPKLIICDEPVSALDVSTQSQVIGLLEELQENLGISYLFIAHDLAVVRHISQRIGVLYLGRLLETGPADRIYESPAHPYTQALLASIPFMDPKKQKQRREIRRQLPVVELPGPADMPPGCPFQARCPHAEPICRVDMPAKVPVEGGGWVACHLYNE